MVLHVTKGTLANLGYLDEVFTNMCCRSIRLLETIFSSSMTMPPYLQHGKELFASWSSHTPLSGLPDPNQYPIDHLWDIWDQRVHDLYPFPASTLPESEHQLVEQWQCIPQGGVYTCIPRLLLSMRKRLLKCINKVGGHTRYDLQYINL